MDYDCIHDFKSITLESKEKAISERMMSNIRHSNRGNLLDKPLLTIRAPKTLMSNAVFSGMVIYVCAANRSRLKH